MNNKKAIKLLNSHKFQQLFDFVIINGDEDYEEALNRVLALIEKKQKVISDKDKHISKLTYDLTKQFDLTMRIFEDSLKLANTIEKIEDVLEDVNIESYNELVDVFLEIRRIIETTKILESEE